MLNSFVWPCQRWQCDEDALYHLIYLSTEILLQTALACGEEIRKFNDPET